MKYRIQEMTAPGYTITLYDLYPHTLNPYSIQGQVIPAPVLLFPFLLFPFELTLFLCLPSFPVCSLTFRFQLLLL